MNGVCQAYRLSKFIAENSKIVFLCVCVCCEITSMSDIIIICYAAPLSCKEQRCLPLLRLIDSLMILVCICICYETHK